MISRLLLPVISWVTEEDTPNYTPTCKHEAALSPAKNLSFLQDRKIYFTDTSAIKLFKLEARVVIGYIQL